MSAQDPYQTALAKLCELYGHEEVAAKAGLNKDYVWQLVNGTLLPSGKPRSPGPAARAKLSEAYPDWMGSVQIGSAPEEEPGDRHRIAQFKTGGKMGNGLVLKDQPGIIRSWDVSKEWLQKNLPYYTSADNLAIVTGFGDSMLGMFNPGDPLVIDTGIRKADVDGVYFFSVDGEGFIKRLQRIPGEGVLVISENKAYRDWTIKPGMQFDIFGKVLKAWRGENY